MKRGGGGSVDFMYVDVFYVFDVAGEVGGEMVVEDGVYELIKSIKVSFLGGWKV